MSIYPKEQRVESTHKGILYPNRQMDHTCAIQAPLPGNVIVIHGVNDVGTYFAAAEEGVCQGLNTRLLRQDIKHASYSVPTAADNDKIVDDPDDLYFKRKPNESTYSPIIPFYWGYRARPLKKNVKQTANGQQIDEYGNRLDKDRAKGGGPFINATTSLPDMWNRGMAGSWIANKIKDDPTHPLLNAPGRMYMILAAKRMAALVSIIRDYDPKETVSIIAHSQGCLVSLLAQAFLLEDGMHPVDTLIMNNPPYSLMDDFSYMEPFMGASGTDSAMEGQYKSINGIQTTKARLQTLINIVTGVCNGKKTDPVLADLQGAEACGVAGARWEPGKDRDNRGKVYLYFCPEDMTVGLENVQGIGWQGVPNTVKGGQLEPVPEMRRSAREMMPTGRTILGRGRFEATGLSALGAGFRQRVFTIKQRRTDPKSPPQPEKVGMPPHDFVLLLHESIFPWKNEHTTAHLASGVSIGNYIADKGLPASGDQFHPNEDGVRHISGEQLAVPVPADLFAGAVGADGNPTDGGKYDHLDPIDAAVSVSTDRGLTKGATAHWVLIDDPNEASLLGRTAGLLEQKDDAIPSPDPSTFDGYVRAVPGQRQDVESGLNQGQSEENQVKVLAVYACYSGMMESTKTGKLLVKRSETVDEVRQRLQHGVSERSMHGAIVGSVLNHRQVTAYDVSVGQGLASSDPDFHAYLCAVADWRLKRPKMDGPGEGFKRASILTWDKFLAKFGKFFNVEPAARQELISGNSDYYSTGELPDCVPTVDKRPPLVINEHYEMVGQPVIAQGDKVSAQ